MSLRTNTGRNQKIRIKLNQLQETGFRMKRITEATNIYPADLTRFMRSKKDFTDELLNRLDRYIEDLKDIVSNI